MTPADLDAMMEGVTAGPWWTDGRYDGTQMGVAIIAARTDAGPLPGNPTRGLVAWSSAILNTEARTCEANARFIAAARELVPALAADLAAARAALAKAQGEVKRLRGAINALYHVVGEMDHAVSHLPSQRKLDRKAVLAAVSDCKSAALKGPTP